MQKQPTNQFMTIDQLKNKWNNFAPVYALMDTAMNSFFYQLIHMLKINTATSIYEVGCGSGRLLPYIITIKNRQTSYLAVDLSHKMIELALQTIKKALLKIPQEISFTDYCQYNHLVMRASDGQKSVQPQAPFDRILCNLVLMLTQDPYQMMRTFHKQAKQNCILGVTVIANTDQTHNYFLSLPDKLRKKKNLPPNKQTKLHKLYDKLKQLGQSTGWQLLVQWNQTIPFHFFEVDEYLENVLKRWQDFSKDVLQDLIQQIKAVFNKQQTLNFPGQLAVFRKSKNTSSL